MSLWRRLRQAVQAVREYPKASNELEETRYKLWDAQQALDHSGEERERLATALCEQKNRLNFFEQKTDALSSALRDFCPKLSSAEETKRFYEERYAAKYAQPQAYAYAICLKEANYPIGYINVDMEEHHDFGYGLRKEFWYKGIVTEAGKAVIGQVKKDGLAFITATHDRNNPRSGGIMRNVGMKYQYSYEEQWQPKNILVTFRLYQLNLDGNESRVYKKYWDTSVVHFIEPNL